MPLKKGTKKLLSFASMTRASMAKRKVSKSTPSVKKARLAEARDLRLIRRSRGNKAARDLVKSI